MFLTTKPVTLKSGKYKLVLNDTNGKNPSTEIVPEDTLITTSNLFSQAKKAPKATPDNSISNNTPVDILALAEKLTTPDLVQLAHELIGLAKSRMSNPD
jgi:hypothetical protein